MVGRPRQLRYGVAVALGVAAMTLVSSCAVLGQDAEQETVLIAADLELTGGGSELGAVFQQALQLRVEQVNQQGLLGNRRLELLVLDNRSDSATSAANLSELAANPDVTAIITGGCDACTIAAAKAINEAAVPTISLAAASQITEPVEERRYLFKLGPPAADTARVLTSALGRADVQTIGLVTTEDVYGQEGQQEMTAAAGRAGIEVVLTETVAAGAEQVGAVAGRIASWAPEPDPGQFLQPAQGEQEQQGPDAVVMWAPQPVTGQLAVAMRDQGYEGGIFLDASAANELFLSGAARAALEGARMVFTETLVIDDVIATSPAKAARQTWFNNYTAQYGTYHAYASFAADAVQVIVEAINQSGSTGRESVHAAIEGMQIDGFSGPIRFRLESHSGLNAQALTTLVAQGDRWRLAS